jgi:flagellar biosynthesis chaperone FliJ
MDLEELYNTFSEEELQTLSKSCAEEAIMRLKFQRDLTIVSTDVLKINEQNIYNDIKNYINARAGDDGKYTYGPKNDPKVFEIPQSVEILFSDDLWIDRGYRNFLIDIWTFNCIPERAKLLGTAKKSFGEGQKKIKTMGLKELGSQYEEMAQSIIAVKGQVKKRDYLGTEEDEHLKEYFAVKKQYDQHEDQLKTIKGVLRERNKELMEAKGNIKDKEKWLDINRQITENEKIIDEFRQTNEKKKKKLEKSRGVVLKKVDIDERQLQFVESMNRLKTAKEYNKSGIESKLVEVAPQRIEEYFEIKGNIQKSKEDFLILQSQTPFDERNDAKYKTNVKILRAKMKSEKKKLSEMEDSLDKKRIDDVIISQKKHIHAKESKITHRFQKFVKGNPAVVIGTIVLIVAIVALILIATFTLLPGSLWAVAIILRRNPKITGITRIYMIMFALSTGWFYVAVVAIMYGASAVSLRKKQQTPPIPPIPPAPIYS